MAAFAQTKTLILLEPVHLQGSWTECQGTEPVASEKQQCWGDVTVTLCDVPVFQGTVYSLPPSQESRCPKEGKPAVQEVLVSSHGLAGVFSHLPYH